MLITSDFDGTISRTDGLKMVLDHFVGPQWRPLEEAMKSGALPERQGLRLCMSLLKASHDEVIQFLLSNLKLDFGFFGDRPCWHNSRPTLQTFKPSNRRRLTSSNSSSELLPKNTELSIVSPIRMQLLRARQSWCAHGNRNSHLEHWQAS